MKILQVVHQFLPDHIGGIELFVKNISLGLLRKGHDVLIFSGTGDVLRDPVEVEKNVDDLRIIFVRDKNRSNTRRFNFFRTFNNRSVAKVLDRVFENFEPEIVHIHHTLYLSGNIIALAKKKGIPVVTTIHDFWFLCHKIHLVDWRGYQCQGPCGGFKCALCLAMDHQGPWSRFYAIFLAIPLLYRTLKQRRLLQSADVLLAPAKFVIQILEKHLKSIGNIIYLPYCVPNYAADTTQFERTDKIRFGYLGSVKAHKGLDTLIEAFNGLVNKKVSLEIKGDITADNAYANELIKGCRNENVSFNGPYDNRHVNEILNKLDVLIVPSIWRETGPMVILEALANKKPVIASNLGGMCELLKNRKNGFLFDHGNPDSLAKIIRSILDEPEILDQFCIKPKNEHDIEYGVEKLIEIYEALI